MRLRDPAIMRACFHPSAHDLPGRVARGAFWMTGLVVLRTLLTLGSTAVLARLLTPTDYGYVAMATIVTEMAALLGFFGLTPILVQKQRLTRLDLDSAFWLSVLLGVGVAALVCAVSFAAAAVFRVPDLVPILWVLSLLFVFEDLSIIHHSIANRLLLFKYEFASQILNLLVRIAVSIGLALSGYGVWSLILGTIAGRAAQLLAIWYLVPYVPRFRYNMNFLRSHWRAGGSYFGSGVLNYVVSNVDAAVVGRWFGPTQLGYYQTAFALPEELRSRLSFTMQKVLFPAYALVQSDHAALRAGVIHSIRILSAIVVPMGVGMAVLADVIVATLYGSQWTEVVPLLRIVAFVGVFRALQALVGNVYFAKGRPDLNLKVGLALAPLALVAVAAGTRWGLPGVALGVLVFNVLMLASTYRALRLIDLPASAALRPIVPVVLASALMAAALYGLRAAVPLERLGSLAELAIAVGVGVCVFFAAMFLLARDTLTELWTFGRSLRAGRAKVAEAP